MHDLNTGVAEELTTIAWRAFSDAYQLSLTVDDPSTGCQLFLAIDDAIEDSFRALRLQYVGDDVIEGAPDALLQRASNRFNLALDLLYVRARRGDQRGMQLLMELAHKACDAKERLSHLSSWEREEADALNCN